MDVYTSRDSVAAGDDTDAPHSRTFWFPDDTSLEDVLKSIVQSRYLPLIAGSRATWSVVSNVPLAVIAQEWNEPRMLPMIETQTKKFEHRRDTLRLFFNYHAQIEPETVYRIFWGFRLNAI
jgi:hypothetical protein